MAAGNDDIRAPVRDRRRRKVAIRRRSQAREARSATARASPPATQSHCRTRSHRPAVTDLLEQHNVQVTTQPAQTSISSVLLNLLPLAFIVGLFWWTGRAARRQLAGLVERRPLGSAPRTAFRTRRPASQWCSRSRYFQRLKNGQRLVDHPALPISELHVDQFSEVAIADTTTVERGTASTSSALLAEMAPETARLPEVCALRLCGW